MGSATLGGDRRQRLFAGPRLQRDLGRAAEKLLVARLARASRSGRRPRLRAFAQLDLADQQLVEQRRIQVELTTGGSALACAKQRRCDQADGNQGQRGRHQAQTVRAGIGSVLRGLRRILSGARPQKAGSRLSWMVGSAAQ